MEQLKRTAVRSAGRLRLRPAQVTRRNAHDAHGHGSHENHHAGPSTESFGRGFYIALAALPASFAIYKLTTSGKDGAYLTRLITDTYSDYKTQWAERNALHTEAIQQPAADKLLFLNESNRNVRHIEHRYPDSLNAVSPWNVPAGQGSINLDHVIAKYEKENFERNEEKLRQVQENKVPAESPFKPFVKTAPGANDS